MIGHTLFLLPPRPVPSAFQPAPVILPRVAHNPPEPSRVDFFGIVLISKSPCSPPVSSLDFFRKKGGIWAHPTNCGPLPCRRGADPLNIFFLSLFPLSFCFYDSLPLEDLRFGLTEPNLENLAEKVIFF